MIGENQCGRITRNTEKNLQGLNIRSFLTLPEERVQLNTILEKKLG